MVSSDHEDNVPTSATLRLQPQVAAPGQARRQLERICEHLPPVVRSDACLILSEIVTNAVVHARTMITIAIECDQRAVAVAVTDNSTHAPQPQHHDDLHEGGRGLLLIDKLATSWGYDTSSDGEGKIVWFRIGS
jgi:anti-sigma regulatory factor (Ser/Thr protein kinase)